MRKSFYFAIPVLLFLAATCSDPKPPGGNDSLPQGELTDRPIPPNCYCADTTDFDSLCREVPHEVLFQPFFGYHSRLAVNIQNFFDEFSWQSFVAYNWPSNASGTPVGSFFSGGDSMRVWETYADPGEVFNSSDNISFLAGKARKAGRKFFYMTSKINPHQLNGSDVTMFDGYALIDRNLNFSLYEEKINPDEVNYINSNGLNTLQGIIAYGKQHKNALTLPPGYYDNLSTATGGQVGAVEFKAVWRILDTSKGDDPSRFYTQQADIFVPKTNTVSGNDMTIQNVTVGMVAIHILHKTKNFPTEIWSTFTHDDNNPDSLQYINKQFSSAPYSYFDPVSYGAPYNTPIKAVGNIYKWAAQPPYAAAYNIQWNGKTYGNQVVQNNTPYITAVAANQKFKNYLKLNNSVWANYSLLGSQWFIGNTDTPGGGSLPAPPILGNPTLETFIQSKSSCIGCHDNAKVISGADTVTTNLSFLFGHAK